MKNLSCIAILAGMIAGCATAPMPPMGAGERLDYAQAVTKDWYTYSEVTALKLIDEYGPPDKIEADRLTWYDKGPWSKIAVWDTEDYYFTGTVGPDDLEQSVSFAVPKDKRKDLAAFTRRLMVSKDGKELAVRGNSEALNILTLNLAHDIAIGARDPSGARGFFDRVYVLSEAGKSSPYIERLLFVPQPASVPPPPGED